MRNVVLFAVLLLALGSCAVRPGGAGSGPASPSGAGVEVSGSVVAGPTCPVVTEPPQSGCAARPVSGAVILVFAADGAQAARLVADADGMISAHLAPGRYRLVPQPVEGLMGTAEEQSLVLEDGHPVDSLVISYDTGIR